MKSMWDQGGNPCVKEREIEWGAHGRSIFFGLINTLLYVSSSTHHLLPSRALLSSLLQSSFFLSLSLSLCTLFPIFHRYLFFSAFFQTCKSYPIFWSLKDRYILIKLASSFVRWLTKKETFILYLSKHIKLATLLPSLITILVVSHTQSHTRHGEQQKESRSRFFLIITHQLWSSFWSQGPLHHFIFIHQLLWLHFPTSSHCMLLLFHFLLLNLPCIWHLLRVFLFRFSDFLFCLYGVLIVSDNLTNTSNVLV